MRATLDRRPVIREYETFIGGPEAHIEERVVYADVLELQNFAAARVTI